jgi:hypothetical protein
VQLAQDRHQGVIGGLRREIVELTRPLAAAASDLEARRSQQQRMQALNRRIALVSTPAERPKPAE